MKKGFSRDSLLVKVPAFGPNLCFSKSVIRETALMTCSLNFIMTSRLQLKFQLCDLSSSIYILLLSLSVPFHRSSIWCFLGLTFQGFFRFSKYIGKSNTGRFFKRFPSREKLYRELCLTAYKLDFFFFLENKNIAEMSEGVQCTSILFFRGRIDGGCQRFCRSNHELRGGGRRKKNIRKFQFLNANCCGFLLHQ